MHDYRDCKAAGLLFCAGGRVLKFSGQGGGEEEGGKREGRREEEEGREEGREEGESRSPILGRIWSQIGAGAALRANLSVRAINLPCKQRF